MALARGIRAPLGTCSSFRRWDIGGVEKSRMGIGGGGGERCSSRMISSDRCISTANIETIVTIWPMLYS